MEGAMSKVSTNRIQWYGFTPAQHYKDGVLLGTSVRVSSQPLNDHIIIKVPNRLSVQESLEIQKSAEENLGCPVIVISEDIDFLISRKLSNTELKEITSAIYSEGV